MGARGTAALTVLAMGAFLGCWSLIHHGTLSKDQISDTASYEMHGDAIVRGAVPYRDVRIEYPPAALPMFVLPSIGHEGDVRAYNRWFDRLMSVCGCLAIAGVALCLRRLGADVLRTTLALGVVTISPLLIGSVLLSRFDLWPTALTVLALAALLWQLDGLAAVLLGVAVGAKLWPTVVAPLTIAWIWRTRDAESAVRWTAALVAVEAVIFLPFAVLAPGPLLCPSAFNSTGRYRSRASARRRCLASITSATRSCSSTQNTALRISPAQPPMPCSS